MGCLNVKDLEFRLVCSIKNVLLTNGLKEGIDIALKSGIEFGKSAIGIVTGKFENLSQVHNAVKNGRIIDNISDILDNVLESATKNDLISKTTSSLIKKGKNNGIYFTKGMV